MCWLWFSLDLKIILEMYLWRCTNANLYLSDSGDGIKIKLSVFALTAVKVKNQRESFIH